MPFWTLSKVQLVRWTLVDLRLGTAFTAPLLPALVPGIGREGSSYMSWLLEIAQRTQVTSLVGGKEGILPWSSTKASLGTKWTN